MQWGPQSFESKDKVDDEPEELVNQEMKWQMGESFLATNRGASFPNSRPVRLIGGANPLLIPVAKVPLVSAQHPPDLRWSCHVKLHYQPPLVPPPPNLAPS